MKEKEPMMNIDEIEEVDIENMSMEELREFIAAAEAEVILQCNNLPQNHHATKAVKDLAPSSKKSQHRPHLRS